MVVKNQLVPPPITNTDWNQANDFSTDMQQADTERWSGVHGWTKANPRTSRYLHQTLLSDAEQRPIVNSRHLQ